MIFRNCLVFSAALLLLGACASNTDENDTQYWQRVSTSESVYQQGPKAQQMLDRDIGRCVVALRELEDLGLVKEPIHVDRQGRVLNPDEEKVEKWNMTKKETGIPTPDTFRDFPGCMKAKGWERVYAIGENNLNTTVRKNTPQSEMNGENADTD